MKLSNYVRICPKLTIQIVKIISSTVDVRHRRLANIFIHVQRSYQSDCSNQSAPHHTTWLAECTVCCESKVSVSGAHSVGKTSGKRKRRSDYSGPSVPDPLAFRVWPRRKIKNATSLRTNIHTFSHIRWWFLPFFKCTNQCQPPATTASKLRTASLKLWMFGKVNVLFIHVRRIKHIFVPNFFHLAKRIN